MAAEIVRLRLRWDYLLQNDFLIRKLIIDFASNFFSRGTSGGFSTIVRSAKSSFQAVFLLLLTEGETCDKAVEAHARVRV